MEKGILQQRMSAPIPKGLRKLLLGLLLFALLPVLASAAPPQSCAARFIGTWEWTGGDATYDVTFHPDGRVACATCIDMTWACNGNSFAFYYGSRKTAIMTLSDDGNLMTGMNLLVTSAPQMAVRKNVFRQQQGEPPATLKPQTKSGQKNGSKKTFTPPEPVAGPFLKKPTCPKGSAAVQGERQYASGRKVPVWYCFKNADVAK